MSKSRRELSIDELVAGVCGGDRRILARAITLVESRRPEDGKRTRELLDRLAPETGRATRVGITGVPGVGKSTFIEALGSRLVERGHRLAVLAVDPSSSRSGGSVLGDKTRMAMLAQHAHAFVRPSPGGDAAGGIARRTREALLVCEAAGFDVVFVETIGVGQSETTVADMVDYFLLLVLAGAGDELQGIKRGVLEFADGVAVTKADGANAQPAERAANELRSALSILRGGATDEWMPRVGCCSAVTGAGIDDVWADVGEHRRRSGASGAFDARRRAQNLSWFETTVDELLRDRFFRDATVAEQREQLRADVAAGHLAPTAAARRLVDGHGHG